MTDDEEPGGSESRATPNTDEMLAALRLAAEYIRQLQPAPGSIDADVQRLVLAKAIAAIHEAAGEDDA